MTDSTKVTDAIHRLYRAARDWWNARLHFAPGQFTDFIPNEHDTFHFADHKALLDAACEYAEVVNRDVALYKAAKDVLAYMDEINKHLTPYERVRLHFKWRDGTDGTEGADLFARLRTALEGRK